MSTSSGTPEPPERPTPAAPDAEPQPEAAAPEPTAEPTADPIPGPQPDADPQPDAAPQPATADAEPTAEPATAPEPEAADPDAPHRRRRRRRLLAAGAGTLALLLVAGAGTAWWAYRRLDGNITTDIATNRILQHQESARPTRNPDPKTYNAENILLIGSDDRSGANGKYGEAGGQRSDTTILLHLSADRKRAVAVSIPRDAMVTVPSCERSDGSYTHKQFVQFNWAFEFGGAACTIRTVEDLTGIRIDHHLIVDFTGFKKMVNAVGGVQVCLNQDVHDRNAKLDLPAGPHKLNGEQALGFVRVRETLGNGSDTERMGRQQQFLSSLVKKVQSDGVLLNPTKLWPLLDAATSSITADPGLSSLGALSDLAESLRSIPAENVAFLTAPREPYPPDHNRDQLVQPLADQLFKALNDDRPVRVTTDDASADDGGQRDKAVKASDSDEPSFSGRTADQDICDKQ
ncbi:LCP family protein [Streptomyces sp. NPDC092296]|uniref:LCP family glycopolymer transferase n=1 Tax=Streptomyces sp. NPDC092296 TaxID=3366012 RepID=UPI00382E5B0E